MVITIAQVALWYSGYHAQLHSTKPELRFSTGSNAARGVSEIRDGEKLWKRSRLGIGINAFPWSTIPQKNNSASSIQREIKLSLAKYFNQRLLNYKKTFSSCVG